MPQVRYPIVGAYFRKPAPAILKALPFGTALFLLAEPDNEYDPNAIQVWVHIADIPDESSNLDHALAGYGTSLAELSAESSDFHLGYIPREIALGLKQRGFPEDFTHVPATFAVGADGKPRVSFMDSDGWGLGDEQ